MGILQAKCRCRVQSERLGKEPVALLGITKSKFVHHRWTDRPRVGDLGVVTVHVSATAIQRTGEQAVIDPGVILLAN